MSRLLVLLNVLTVSLLCLLTVGMFGCGGGMHGETPRGPRVAAPAASVAVHNMPVEDMLATEGARQFVAWMGLAR